MPGLTLSDDWVGPVTRAGCRLIVSDPSHLTNYLYFHALVMQVDLVHSYNPASGEFLISFWCERAP
jgi:hypothetical protein